jgi:hypothetical protein
MVVPDRLAQDYGFAKVRFVLNPVQMNIQMRQDAGFDSPIFEQGEQRGDHVPGQFGVARPDMVYV